MEEYSGAYMRLLHNVFRVNQANYLLATHMRTAPVHADRKATLPPLATKHVERWRFAFAHKC